MVFLVVLIIVILLQPPVPPAEGAELWASPGAYTFHSKHEFRNRNDGREFRGENLGLHVQYRTDDLRWSANISHFKNSTLTTSTSFAAGVHAQTAPFDLAGKWVGEGSFIFGIVDGYKGPRRQNQRVLFGPDWSPLLAPMVGVVYDRLVGVDAFVLPGGDGDPWTAGFLLRFNLERAARKFDQWRGAQ